MTSSRRRLGKGDYQSLADFRYVLRQFLSFSEEAATRTGLAPQQHQALLAIKGAGGKMSIGDLAQRLLVRPHSAVGLVDRLVDAKLLQRDTDQKDRRRVLLSLTPTAESVLKSLTVAHRDELNRVAPTLKSLLSELEE
ncbi:MAG TPA: MarR family transcriptional regulator [Rhizomicrobium sp.]|nr:MarR family transcriptional regulator [Rhizomicrobium sp.]